MVIIGQELSLTARICRTIEKLGWLTALFTSYNNSCGELSEWHAGGVGEWEKDRLRSSISIRYVKVSMCAFFFPLLM